MTDIKDWGLVLNKPPKRYKCDRLFGGPLHRKRSAYVHSPYCQGVQTAHLPKPLMFMPAPDSPSGVTTFQTIDYTPRKVLFGRNKMVTFYADSRLSDEEAADRFFTYLLDRSCISDKMIA